MQSFSRPLRPPKGAVMRMNIYFFLLFFLNHYNWFGMAHNIDVRPNVHATLVLLLG